ncbi:hypothetical protein CPT_Moonbeam175 [Bacillus phage Moonbeam]|uniref:Uncharacterized protein n=1 Tax=Bacillus phage Moonbeam TaxID=1540091 RepID=A0A0A0RV98_9CAUD|nr:hypothetical protein CPT_Moonbeam175 [Bacillus phage Moonbeam]AIW03573.1 hypothetical protein CPT_Moonbeam175 [Bacillus phage Moonbeam]
MRLTDAIRERDELRRKYLAMTSWYNSERKNSVDIPKEMDIAIQEAITVVHEKYFKFHVLVEDFIKDMEIPEEEKSND